MRPRGAVVGVAAGLTSACALVIGLDERPGRPAGGTSGDGAAFDAGVAPTSSFCGANDGGAGSLFCDDFDEAPPLAKWKGFGAAPAIAEAGATRLAVVASDRAASPPNLLSLELDASDPERAFGVIVTGTTTGGAPAAELSFDFAVDELTPCPPPAADAGAFDGGNPDQDLVDECKVAIGALGTVAAGEPTGAVVLVGERSLVFAIAKDPTARTIVGGPGDNYGRIGRVNAADLSQFGYIRATIIAGAAAAVRAHATARFGQAPDCPEAAALAVAGTNVTFAKTKCLAMNAAVTTFAAMPLVVSVGASITQSARVRLRTDNVVLRAVP